MGRKLLASACVVACLLTACSSDGDSASTAGSGAPDVSVTTTEPASTQTTESTMTEPTTQPASTGLPPLPTDADELRELAYVWGYPLVVTQRTMQTLGALLGVNQLFWQNSLSGPDSRLIVAPNRDTLYSVAILDLRSEPMVLTAPEIDDRYFTYQFLDAYTESFAYLGTRATGGDAGTWFITPPNWEGELPEGAQQIESPTNQVFLLGRFLVDDDADVANVTAISDEVTLELLSSYRGDDPPPAPSPLGEAPGTPQSVSSMGVEFFDELGDALAVNPPTDPYGLALLETLEPLGIGPGLHPSGGSDDEQLLAAVDAGNQLIQTNAARIAEPVNGWNTSLGIGVYGGDFPLRATVARVGWGANVTEEAVYPVSRVDGNGDVYDGTNSYTMRFEADQLPPVEAFWSLSAYGSDLFFTEHPSGKYTVGDRTPGLVYGDDGSLTITIQHEEPASYVANWLPVPAGPFVLMMRMYLPTEEVLDGSYQLPPVEQQTG